jgi:putative tryptophan/tyrosine transport system substrate-binding protein
VIITKKGFRTALVALLLPLTFPAEAQQSKVHRVGVLMLIKPDRPQLQGLRDGLRDAGYIEGQNLTLDMPAPRSTEELRSLAKDYIKQKVNVIVTTGNAETKIAKENTQHIPIVFMPAADPLTAGFVKSFPQPGTNLTGVALMRDLDSYGKQLEIFKEAIPPLGKVVVLYDARSENPLPSKGIGQLKKVASSLGIELDEKRVLELREAERIVASLSRNSVDGIFIVCSSLFGGDIEAIIKLAIGKKLPLPSCGSTQEGSLISLSLNLYQVGLRAGWYVAQIFKGATPQDLPVEVPLKYELAINLRTANAIGIKIPPEVLQQADKVIR